LIPDPEADPALTPTGLRFIGIEHEGCSQKSDAEADRVRQAVKAACAAVSSGGRPPSRIQWADPAPPTVYPARNILIADCDFGKPANTAQPYYL